MSGGRSHSHAHTYTPGDGDLAVRAREIGVRHRAAQRHRRRISSDTSAGMLISSRLHIAAVMGVDDESDEEPEDYHQGPKRVPSWLADAMSARESRLQHLFLEQEAPAEPHVSPTIDEGDEEKPPGEQLQGGFTLFEAFLASIKGAVGPAVLYTPKGFDEGGFIFALAMLSLSYTLFGFGSMRLLETWRRYRKSYASLMGKAYGKSGVYLVRLTIVAQQCGICMTYFIFVATNLQEVMIYFLKVKPSLAILCLVQILVYFPLACIRDLQFFAYTNLIANGLILYSLGVLAVFAFCKFTTPSGGLEMTVFEDNVSLFNPNQFYLFIGTSAFIYEGSAALVIPLQEAVREDIQKDFAPLFLKTALLIVVTYVIFGFINWSAYGKHVETVLTLNLPKGPWKASVQMAYLVAVVFTFPLQLFPAIQILKIIAQSSLRKLARRRRRWHQRQVEREFYSSPSYAAVGAFDPPVTATGAQENPLRNPDDKISMVRKDGASVVSSSSTTPLQHQPVERIGDDPPFKVRPWWSFSLDRCKANAARLVLVVILASISILCVKSLDKLVALLGGLLGIPLAFVYPVAIHLKLITDAPHHLRSIDCLCIFVGLCLSLACTAVTVATW